MLRASSLRPYIFPKITTLQCLVHGRHGQSTSRLASVRAASTQNPRPLPQRDSPPHVPLTPSEKESKENDYTLGNTDSNGPDELDLLLLGEEPTLSALAPLPHRVQRRPIAPLPLPEDLVDRTGALRTIATTGSVTDAWNAFQNLNYTQEMPEQYLHRVAAFLSRVHPRTRELHERLKTVLTQIQALDNGVVHLAEWTALIDTAGKGWRRVQPEDFQASLDVFAEMSASLTPDIVAYTTLLNVATRSLNPKLVQHAANLLKASGLAPNRITHLCMMSYFTYSKDLNGVRSTVIKMREQGFDLGMEGVNAFMWGCGYNDAVNVASTIYRVLRHNLEPEDDSAIQPVLEWLADNEFVSIPHDMVPDKVTYIGMLQIYAYRGDLIRALHVFMDMIRCSTSTETSPDTFPAFRAIFVGFSKHGQKRDWTLENLHQLFESFLALPDDVSSTRDHVIFWIILSFIRVGANDKTTLRLVWTRLEDKYGQRWGYRLGRMRDAAFDEGRETCVDEASMFGKNSNKTNR